MAHDPRARSEAQRRRRADGVTIAPAPGARKALLALAGAAALAAIALLVVFAPRRESTPQPDASARAPERVAVRLDAAPSARPRAKRVTPPASPRAPAAQVETPAESPAPEPEPLPPTPSGIGLFPPPGTDPVKIGIRVPEGFELPEGYVRHYQVTDDGQPLPPILMFHPDYDWVDESGQHVEVEGGVVPPELAPPGMPIEMLELPEAPSEP
jgi:hypothetical protein